MKRIMKNWKTLFTVCFIFGLVGCSATPGEYNFAEKVCEQNGGVRIIWIVGNRLDVDCKNGANFDVPKVMAD